MHTETLDTTAFDDPPAPAERAELEEMEKLFSVIQESPVFRALLDWLEGFIVVLNPQRQILAASESLMGELGLEGNLARMGTRPGELLGCVQAQQAPDGCGTGKGCRFCGALKAILESQEGDKPVDGICKLTLRGADGQVETRKFRIRATRVEVRKTNFTILVFQGTHELLPAPLTTLTPTELAGYSVVRKIGEGGMGTVYLVMDGRGGQMALKMLRSQAFDIEGFLERFDLESDICLRLSHPHIVDTYEVGQTSDGVLYMITEYCSHGSTYQYMQRAGLLAPDLALSWMIGVARGLDHAWRTGRIVHRDIKPDNLLIHESGRIKITDFGLALDLAKPRERITRSGLVMGTPHYMSPEQSKGSRDLDVRSDLYALGATFYELLAGRPPFEAADPTDILRAHISLPPVPIDQLRPDLPFAMVEVIHQLLAKDRNDRPAEATALVDRLTAIAEEMGVDIAAPSSWLDGGAATAETVSPFSKTAAYGLNATIIDDPDHIDP